MLPQDIYYILYNYLELYMLLIIILILVQSKGTIPCYTVDICYIRKHDNINSFFTALP